jgi:hypothetical protein
MGGKPKRVDTSAMDAQLARQEQLLREQEARIAAREAEVKAREEPVKAQEEARRRVRENRFRGRALLLGGSEAGTEDQPLPFPMQRRLGG